MECPTCDRRLSTQAGLRQHHTKVHGNPLPNRTCSDCGSEFYDPNSRRTYCEDCDPNAGSNNGNWSDALETSDCTECGEQFEYYPSNRDGVYCSRCIQECDGLLPDNPADKIERVRTDCPACGTTRHVLQSRLDRRKRGVFCDMDCYGDWLSAHIVGSDHHQWSASEPTYNRGWWTIRRAARVRDDHRCQICGVTKSELGRHPDVHHIQPVRSFEDPREAHRLDNVIALCRSCHRKVESESIPAPSPGNE
ncbi:HNH endonuclease [Salinarchaeum laminariae]|uniref:HNH endonuclease n=1 Tax=Salinarchaeum laminariae TaxID=869888 RepID=UPI0020C06D41|nr:HNH endonuclease signature motif containing protein [Salinarchaeum laminariae]